MSSKSVSAEASLVPMGPQECLALLRQHRVGRLAVVIDGQPHVFPLNYAADDEGVIVFRTAELTAATEAALARVWLGSPSRSTTSTWPRVRDGACSSMARRIT
jgi:hypothetical protein